MAFPFGILLTWLGIAGLWVAFHGTAATTPWGVFQEMLGQGADGSAGTLPNAGTATNPDSTPGANPASATGYGGNDGDILDQTVNGVAKNIAGQFPKNSLNPDGYTGSGQ